MKISENIKIPQNEKDHSNFKKFSLSTLCNIIELQQKFFSTYDEIIRLKFQSTMQCIHLHSSE